MPRYSNILSCFTIANEPIPHWAIFRRSTLNNWPYKRPLKRVRFSGGISAFADNIRKAPVAYKRMAGAGA